MNGLTQLVWRGAEGYRGVLARITALSALTAVAESVTLLALFAFLADLAGTRSTTGSASFVTSAFSGVALWIQATLVLAIATVRFALTLGLEWRMSSLWTGLRRSMQTEMLSRHLGTRVQYLVERKGGEHLYHIMEGPSFAAVFYLHLVRYLSTVILIALLFVTLAFVSWTLILIAAAVAVLYGLVVRRVSASVSYSSGEIQAAAVKAQTQLVVEGLAGVRYLKALFAIPGWMREFDKESVRAMAAMRRAMFWGTVPSRALEYLVLVLFLVIVLLALGRGGDLMTEMPTLAVYFLGITRILPTLSILGNARMQMMQALPNLRTYCELRASIAVESTADSAVPVPADLAHARLVFEDVDFAYTDKRVLGAFRASLGLGRVSAIVGASGEGKSTIVDLILRFIEPQAGRVTLDGTDIRTFNLSEWRSRFGYLGQEPFLFHASVADNVRLGNTGASEREIHEALRMAGADEFVGALPLGIDTVLADRGQSLSGGQRQRIALARAFISPAEVLVLDEPTSALDPETESRIMANLVAARGGRGVILVTHKEDLLAFAEDVLMIEEGRAIAAGAHGELRERSEHYRRIFRATAG